MTWQCYIQQARYAADVISSIRKATIFQQVQIDIAENSEKKLKRLSHAAPKRYHTQQYLILTELD